MQDLVQVASIVGALVTVATALAMAAWWLLFPRLRKELELHLKPLAQLERNEGKHMRDAVDRIEKDLGEVRKQVTSNTTVIQTHIELSEQRVRFYRAALQQQGFHLPDV